MFYLVIGRGKRQEKLLEEPALDTQVGSITLRMLEQPLVKSVEVQSISQRTFLRLMRHPFQPPEHPEAEEDTAD